MSVIIKELGGALIREYEIRAYSDPQLYELLLKVRQATHNEGWFIAYHSVTEKRFLRKNREFILYELLRHKKDLQYEAVEFKIKDIASTVVPKHLIETYLNGILIGALT